MGVFDAELSEGFKALTGGIRAERVSRDVRKFLAEAMGFLNGLKTASGYADYSLDQALSAHLEDLAGTPANGRLNQMQRLDALLAKATTAVTAASLLDEDDLGSELVAAGSFSQMGGLLPGAEALGGLLPDSLPDNDVADVFAGSGVSKAKQAFSGDRLALAKDVLT